MCALFVEGVEEYVHLLWGENVTAIHKSRRQEVKKCNMILNVPSNIQVIHFKLQISGEGGGGGRDKM